MSTTNEILSSGNSLVPASEVPFRGTKPFMERPLQQQLAEIALCHRMICDFAINPETTDTDRLRGKSTMNNLTDLAFHVMAPAEFNIDAETKMLTVDFIERCGIAIAAGLPTYV